MKRDFIELASLSQAEFDGLLALAARLKDEVKRGMQRLIVLGIRRDIRLRAGRLVALGLQMSAQR